MKKGDKLNNSESLLRRVYRRDKRYINPKTGIPTSRAFSPRPMDDKKLSVDLERLTSLEAAIKNPDRFRLFRISSGLCYTIGLECVYDPIEDNVAHTLIVGFKEDDESIPGILARQAIDLEKE